MLSLLLLLLISNILALPVSPCRPITGNLTINLPDVYPKGADFSTDNCKIYISSTTNGTLIELDPYTGVTQIFNIPGVTGNQEYLTCGIDYSSYTQSLYLSVSARAAFITSGANLSGPNEIIHFDRQATGVAEIINVDNVVNGIEKQVNQSIGGFQDQAEDCFGNIYYMATWGNVLLKVDPAGNVSPFYIPPPEKLNSAVASFGGLFITDSVLVVSDAISGGFYVFDLGHVTSPGHVPGHTPPPAPHLAPVIGLNQGSTGSRLCNSLYSPTRYGGKVALCTRDVAFGTGGIAVFMSVDRWATVKYMGFISNDYEQAPGGSPSATFQAGESVYTLLGFIPGSSTEHTPINVFPLIDITSKVDLLVK